MVDEKSLPKREDPLPEDDEAVTRMAEIAGSQPPEDETVSSIGLSSEKKAANVARVMRETLRRVDEDSKSK